MLAYRHRFHAGNFADVFKHSLLTQLLAALCAKVKPWCYIDTHAGIGLYDLKHAWTQKMREYEGGIGRLWHARDVPEALEPYLRIVRAENPGGRLRYYPGSPIVARRHVRAADRLVLTELNRVDCAELAAVFAHDRRVAVQHMDGYHTLKAYLPPAERRGLVLIDSSFDRAREFARLTRALKDAFGRWPTGMYAIWYPLMEPAPMRDFYADVQRSGTRKVLRLELTVRGDRAEGALAGCGMLIVNPPWRFEAAAAPMLEWLAGALAAGTGAGSRVDWLVPE
jgi:23S rRNA (adenine2030-N6)-methyltransferase